MSVKTSIEDVKEAVEKNGSKLLTTEYKNNSTKLDVICPKGHLHHPTFKAIKKGGGCGICYNSTEHRHNIKYKPEKIKEAKQIAENNGGKCLSDTYYNNRTSLLFQCDKGHQWETNLKTIRKAWCPICNLLIGDDKSNFVKNACKNGSLDLKTLNETVYYPLYCKMAKDRGGVLVSKEYKASDEKLEWRCKNGHEWEATPSNIKGGHWCPYCAQFSSERICATALKKLLGKEFKKERPDWLKYKSRNLELDGYCECLNIAFEHNGDQHYKNVDYFKYDPIKDSLEERQKRDSFKEQKCKDQGVKLIVIPPLLSVLKIENLIPFLKNACDSLGIKYSNREISLKDLECEKFINIDFEEKLKEIKSIAISKGGECLSNVYFGLDKKLKFKCSCGFEWKASGSSIKRGIWCEKCRAKNSTKLTLQDIQTFAATQNTICLDDKYINNHSKMKWKCLVCDHKWNTTYNCFMYNGCSKCNKRKLKQIVTLGIEVYQKVAAEFGGKCLSQSVNSAHDKLEWECSEGHRWFSKACNVKNNKHWCSECYRIRMSKQKEETLNKKLLKATNKIKLGIEAYQKVAQEKGGKCLSTTVKNAIEKLEWECSEGHRWFAVAGQIKNTKQWCPECYRLKRSTGRNK